MWHFVGMRDRVSNSFQAVLTRPTDGWILEHAMGSHKRGRFQPTVGRLAWLLNQTSSSQQDFSTTVGATGLLGRLAVK